MTGTFALTFDTELIWGSFDTLTPERFVQRYPDVRRIIDRTLPMLERYEVAATWAVVGHLFLRSCVRGASGLAHPELVRPTAFRDRLDDAGARGGEEAGVQRGSRWGDPGDHAHRPDAA